MAKEPSWSNWNNVTDEIVARAQIDLHTYGGVKYRTKNLDDGSRMYEWRQRRRDGAEDVCYNEHIDRRGRTIRTFTGYDRRGRQVVLRRQTFKGSLLFRDEQWYKDAEHSRQSIILYLHGRGVTQTSGHDEDAEVDSYADCRNIHWSARGVVVSRRTRRSDNQWYAGNGAIKYRYEVVGEGSLYELDTFQRDSWQREDDEAQADDVPTQRRTIKTVREHYKKDGTMTWGGPETDGRMNGLWTSRTPLGRVSSESFYINGVKVPKWVYEDGHTAKPEEILSEENTEVRRVLMEKVGYEVFLARCGDRAKLIDKDPDPLVGELWHINIKIDDDTDEDNKPVGMRLLKVKDGTLPKHYVLRVPPTINTAKAANAWTWELSASKYAPEVEA